MNGRTKIGTALFILIIAWSFWFWVRDAAKIKLEHQPSAPVEREDPAIILEQEQYRRKIVEKIMDACIKQGGIPRSDGSTYPTANGCEWKMYFTAPSADQRNF